MSSVSMKVNVFPADAEWLLTDGRSGYACGTVDDLARRRYHGLWVAYDRDSGRRHLVVAGVDEQIPVEGELVSTLHAHWGAFDAAVPPELDVSFAARPWPTHTFDHEAFRIERSVLLQAAGGKKEPALLMRWRNLSEHGVRIFVRPLLGWCDVDHLPSERAHFSPDIEARGASWGVRPDTTLPTLWVTANGVAAFRADPGWYRDFLYEVDRDRGYDCRGDRYCPGVLELDLPAKGEAVVSFALGEPCAEPARAWSAAAAAARKRWSGVGDGMFDRLAATADDFFYRTPEGRRGVLAGFPWFGEWGRDVFLALPGLSLARGRPELCEEVLSGALAFLRGGLLPNIYEATIEESHYGSCDAALWFALAVQRFAAAGGDEQLVRKKYLPALVDIAEHYLAGTDLGLKVTADGLLAAGGPGLNATWMDARTSAGPVTPREGLPVEIQALWYALLSFLADSGQQGFAARAKACKNAFVERFWLAEGRYLADRVYGDWADPSVRPNMLVTAALPRSPLSRAQRADIVAMAERELVTPCGLRTLSPVDPSYCGRYRGGGEERDGAYHQGTVWPWLAGFYVEAALAAATKTQRKKVERRLRAWLEGMAPELDRAGIGHVSEVFDGDAPHEPGGTFAQAWSSGELLRALALLTDS